MQHLRSNIRDGFIVAIVVWSLLYAFDLYQVTRIFLNPAMTSRQIPPRPPVEPPKLTQEELQQIQNAVRQAIEKSPPPRLPEQAAKNKEIVRPNPPFSFAIDVAMFSPTRDHSVMLYLAFPGGKGPICPANLALYLRLQNLQTIPARISGWSLELGYGDRWTEAVTLDTRFGTMYFITDDRKSAGRIDNQNGFDVQLAARSYVLKPGDSVEGWALFEYPKNFPVFAGGYRLSVKDTLGHEWSGVVTWPDPKEKNTNSLGGQFRFIGIEDVSSFPVKYCDE
jgi:hypothetical protein